jgi:alkylation response protein AidB-like acyl-CoA dehydrogenase
MDFSVSEADKALREEIRQFVQKELPPEFWRGAYDMLENQYTEDFWPTTQVIARKLGEKNWLAPHWPKEYGGEGASYTKYLVCQEELIYHGVPATDMGVGGISWIGPSMMLFANEEQKKTHLPKIARGETFWCTAYSEPNAGSDLASLHCRAVAKGDHYIINGQKIWTSAGYVADWCWLAARTSTEGSKHRGISLFMVDMKSKGITVRPIVGMGGRVTFSEIFFDEVAVPKENLVGEENRGWNYIITALASERVGVGTLFTAITRRMLDDLVVLVRDIKRKGKPLSRDPLVRNKLAEMAIEVEIGRMLTYRAAWLQSQGLPTNYEGPMSKLYTSELSQRLAQTGMEILGLFGQLGSGSKYACLYGSIMHTYLASIGNTLLAGTSEIERNIIATIGLGLPR